MYQTRQKPKVAEKETQRPEQKPQEKPKSQEAKTNQEQSIPKDQTSTKQQSNADFEAKLKQRMFEEQLKRRTDELKQARSQGKERDDETER